MIRYIVLAAGLASMTGAALWGLSSGNTSAVIPDQVSRTNPDPLGLQPDYTGLAQSSDQVPEIYSQAISNAQITFEPALTPEPEPARQFVTATPPAAPAAAEPTDMMHVMSMGIMKELQKPAATKAPEPKPVIVAAPQPQPQMRRYTVQEGDSLSGLAFQFYGTTSAYLQILNANPDVISSPSEMRAGMVLRLPDLP
jgi:nucleoid-associated protein YgaU